MAAESIPEQIAARLEVILQPALIDPGVDGEYWYKPDKTVRVDAMDVRLLSNRNYNHVILIGPGDEYETEKAALTIDHSMDVFVLAARQYKPDQTDPYLRYGTGMVINWTIQNRLVRDLIRALVKDVTLNNLCINCEIKDISRDFAVPEGWSIVILRLVILFDHQKDLP